MNYIDILCDSYDQLEALPPQDTEKRTELKNQIQGLRHTINLELTKTSKSKRKKWKKK